MSLAIGQEIFHGYKLRQRLGQGAYGTVWEAARDGEAPVALKFLPQADSRANRKEIKAIQMIAALKHPNLTTTYDVWSYQHYFVVAMEMAEGSMHELLEASLAEESAPLDRRDVCPLLEQAAEALDFLNARRHQHEGRLVAIQHCDIKPSNLLLFGDTLKLADFGLAAVTSQQVQFKRPAGTPAYMAPELMMGRISDRSDQFSLAVTYIQMRTGKLPWPEEEPDPERQTWPVPDLSGLQPKERTILSRALSNVAQERWPSCKELMARLGDGPSTAFMRPKATQQGTEAKPTLHGQVKPIC